MKRMNNNPVFTIENECRDCYKCVRNCYCKAIRIINGKASVIPEACVSCGVCVKVCPQHAKKIRVDIARLRELLKSGSRVVASVAPSYVGYFQGIGIKELSAALRKAGFAGVSETAHGAQALSAKTCEFLKNTKLQLIISSACPSCVDYIRKYAPQFTGNIEPLCSPVQAHCRLLRKTYGDDIKIVFIGPCAAKKNEADRNPELLDLAMTFSEIEDFLDESGVSFNGLTDELLLGDAEEGRFYAAEGGMNDTLREPFGGKQIRFVAVSGLRNLGTMLSTWQGGSGGRAIFLEALACAGGCVSGPVMPAEAASLEFISQTENTAQLKSSAKRDIKIDIGDTFAEARVVTSEPTEDELRAALARVGKFGKSDELNCGACGYSTCRGFARALLENKAEEPMCQNFLRQNYQRTSNALIKYIPAAVVIVDERRRVIDCNRNFAVMSGLSEIFDTIGNLDTYQVSNVFPELDELFGSVLSNGGEIEKFSLKFKDRIVNLSVFTIARCKSAGAVIQDATVNELHREQIAGKAREVIQKNVITVQRIARLLGEHIADTETMLNEIAGTYEVHSGERRDYEP